MSYFLVAFSVVFPMCCMFAVGRFIKSSGLMDEGSLNKLNNVNFRVFFFAMLFRNTARIDIDSIHPGPIVIFALSATAITIAASLIFVCLTEKDPRKRGVLIQTFYRSNYTIYGLTMVESVFGAEALAIPSLLSGVIVPIYNVTAVIVLECFRGKKLDPWGLFCSVLKNPLIQGSLLGLLVALLRIQIPPIIMIVINKLGDLASPLALIILGANFKANSLGKYRKDLILYGLLRLVGIPLAVIAAAVACGFRGVELLTILAFAGTPAASSIYVMAQQMGGDDDLAASVILVTGLGSLLTLFLWVYALKALMLI